MTYFIYSVLPGQLKNLILFQCQGHGSNMKKDVIFTNGLALHSSHACAPCFEFLLGAQAVCIMYSIKMNDCGSGIGGRNTFFSHYNIF